AAILGLDEAKTREVCAETGVELANLNCPGQIVISGPSEKLERACAGGKYQWAERAVLLPVAGSYHSKLMAGASARLDTVLKEVQLQPARVPVISNVTAQPHGAPAEIHQRMVDQVTSSVRWEDSMRHLLAQGFTRFIELGPGKARSGFMKRIDANVQVLTVADAPSLAATVQALKASV